MHFWKTFKISRMERSDERYAAPLRPIIGVMLSSMSRGLRKGFGLLFRAIPAL